MAYAMIGRQRFGRAFGLRAETVARGRLGPSYHVPQRGTPRALRLKTPSLLRTSCTALVV